MAAHRLAWCLVALPLLAATASAHENKLVADELVSIAPGASVEYPVTLHYHRLVGAVAAEGSSLVVGVSGPGGTTRVAGPGSDLRVDALVRCCKGTTWAEHVVTIENVGAAAASPQVRLVLLHDGLSVTADDAGAGAAVSLLVLVAVPSALALRRLRRRQAPAETRRPLAVAWGALAALCLLAAALALPSMLLYGGGPAAGAMASAAHLPWVGNAFVTTSDLLLLALLALWILALLAWASAARRERTATTRLLGGVLAAGALAASIAWAIEGPSWPVPLLAGVAASAVPLAWAWRAPPRVRADEGLKGEAPDSGPP